MENTNIKAKQTKKKIRMEKEVTNNKIAKSESKGRYICKIVNSLVSNFALVLFDFALRERLVKQTTTKIAH